MPANTGPLEGIAREHGRIETAGGGARAEQVRDGMKLGLGTGSTAKHFVDLLGEKVRAGLNVVGVPTSEATRIQAEQCGVR